jgi:hypothetical protein
MLRQAEAYKAAARGDLAALDDCERAKYITDHLAEILDLPPEISRIDMATFQCTTSAAGAVIAQPPTVRFNADYVAELFGMIGNVDDTITDIGLGSESHIFFNIREQGRDFDVFVTPTPMCDLMNQGGTIGQIEFPRGAYVFRPGTDVQLRFQVDAVFAGGVVTTVQKVWTVTLLLNLARAK